MLCQFAYYEAENKKKESENVKAYIATNATTDEKNNDSDNDVKSGKILMPSILEYLLIYWVLMLAIQELGEVFIYLIIAF
jgi:hypothetical protein